MRLLWWLAATILCLADAACFQSRVSTVPRMVIDKPIVKSEQACQNACMQNVQCRGYTYGKTCTLLGKELDSKTCAIPETIAIKSDGCTESTTPSTTTENAMQTTTTGKTTTSASATTNTPSATTTTTGKTTTSATATTSTATPMTTATGQTTTSSSTTTPTVTTTPPGTTTTPTVTTTTTSTTKPATTTSSKPEIGDGMVGDPCGTLVPGIRVGKSPICPSGKNYVIRAKDKNGVPITLDNDGIKAIEWVEAKGMWSYFYDSYSIYLTAASCATADDNPCSCEPLPKLKSSIKQGVAAEINQSPICPTAKMSIWFTYPTKPGTQTWMAADFTSSMSIRCRAGIWIAEHNDKSGGYQMSNATCFN